MGITGASLYNAFGDKRSLFRELLQRYTERAMRERIARLESTLSPKQAISAFLGEIVERSVDGDRRGCLLVNTALEIAPHDPELGAEVAARFAEIEAFFRRGIAAAQADGSVPPDREPADLARLLLGVTLGVRVLARSKISRARSGSLNTMRMIAQSAESITVSETMRMSVVSKWRTRERRFPTRFSRNTLNCRTLGQSRPRAVL